MQLPADPDAASCYSSARLLPMWTAVVAIGVIYVLFPDGIAAIPQLPISVGTLLLLIPVFLLLRAALQIRKSVRDVVGVTA